MGKKRKSARFTKPRRGIQKTAAPPKPAPVVVRECPALKRCPLCNRDVDEHEGRGHPCSTCSVDYDELFCVWCVSICEGCSEYYCYGCNGVSHCSECDTEFCQGCMGDGCSACGGTDCCVECVAQYGGKCAGCAATRVETTAVSEEYSE